MKIIVDVDGILRDIIPPITHIYNRRVRRNGEQFLTTEAITDYNIFQFMPNFKKCYTSSQDFFRKHAKEIFLESQPIPGAVENVKQLYVEGHEIIVGSAQCKGLEHLTCYWLQEHKVPYHSLFFGDKTTLKADLLIDDNPDNHKKFEGVSVSLANKYNTKDMNVIKSWNDICSYIK